MRDKISFWEEFKNHEDPEDHPPISATFKKIRYQKCFKLVWNAHTPHPMPKLSVNKYFKKVSIDFTNTSLRHCTGCNFSWNMDFQIIQALYGSGTSPWDFSDSLSSKNRRSHLTLSIDLGPGLDLDFGLWTRACQYLDIFTVVPRTGFTVQRQK